MLRSDLLRLPSIPPRKFNHPRKRLSCLSPRNGCRIVSTIYRETNHRFPPLDFSPVINSSLDINWRNKKENRYDSSRRDDGGTDFVSFDELRSQTNLTSNSDPLPSQLFFPPVQLLLEFQDTGREDEGGESGVKIGITDDTYRSSISFITRD